MTWDAIARERLVEWAGRQEGGARVRTGRAGKAGKGAERTPRPTIFGRVRKCPPWLRLALALAGLACGSAAGPHPHAPGRMSGLGVVPHGIDVANALAVADAQAGGQKQLISGTQATIL